MNNLSILPNIMSIAEDFAGILLDAYGVFWSGNVMGLLPGAKETMEALVSSGKIVGILSNSTQLASKEIDKWHKHGMIEGKHFHFLVTSGEIAKQVFKNNELPFKTPHKKFYLFSEQHPKYSSSQTIFQESNYTETTDFQKADFIYISIPHLNGEDQIDPNIFRKKVLRFKGTDLPMVCANPDRFAHEGDPPKAVVRQGSIAALYEEIGGFVFYIGKPFNTAYSMAMKYFYSYNIIHPTQVLMVGDTPETDIRGAHHFGMASALVTQTGIMSDRIYHHGLENVMQQFQLSDYPNFFIERLATYAF